MSNTSSTSSTSNATKSGWTWMVSAGAMLSLLVACSGSINGVGGGGDGGTGGDGGGGGGGGDNDAGTTCTSGTIDANRACVPGLAQAGVPLSIQVDGQGCTGCGTTLLPCKVDVHGQTIGITIEQTTCTNPHELCPANCGLPRVTCAIPALAAGTYTLDLTKSAHSSEEIVRQIVVTDSAKETSCTIDGATPLPIAAKDFPQTCVTENDCMVIAEGDVCQPCACPAVAIAKSAQASYEAELRKRRALCPGNSGGPVCAACLFRAPLCDNGKCIAAAPR